MTKSLKFLTLYCSKKILFLTYKFNLSMILTKKTPEQIRSEIQAISDPPIVLIENDGPNYDLKRKPFNRRFDIKPAVIAMCRSAEQAAHVVRVVKSNPDYELRVRSGGHDHEAECTATGAVVIDFSEMKQFSIDKKAMRVKIGSGVLFKDIIPSLDENHVSIPHGTCETVGAMGFTLGGGWGPWTRKWGMCCEYLVGATIINPDGKIRYLDIENEEDKPLLWALRGGGGFSFGICAEIVLQCMEQPKQTLRFAVKWESTYGHTIAPAIKILEAWEAVIAPNQNKALLGTNLQIMAIPEDDKSIDESVHDCTFYGYYGADVDSEEALVEMLKKDLNTWFKDVPPSSREIIKRDQKDQHNFGSWHRVSTQYEKLKSKSGVPILGYFPPDIDFPAPHKLTSKLVKEEGLGEEGRKNLIRTLRSTLISKEGIQAHLHTYVTLGAICGNYYTDDFEVKAFPNGCAFPYQKRPYTIQYQAWWNESAEDIQAGRKYHVNAYINQAQDWIQEARDFNFPQTRGAFISFKDRSIPTSQYFLESFDQLKAIKKEQDPDNMFRSRKTVY